MAQKPIQKNLDYRPSRNSRAFVSVGKTIQPMIKKCADYQAQLYAKLSRHWVEIVGVQLSIRTRPLAIKKTNEGLCLILAIQARDFFLIEAQKIEILGKVRDYIGGMIVGITLQQTKDRRQMAGGVTADVEKFTLKEKQVHYCNKSPSVHAERQFKKVTNTDLRAALCRLYDDINL